MFMLLDLVCLFAFFCFYIDYVRFLIFSCSASCILYTCAVYIHVTYHTYCVRRHLHVQIYILGRVVSPETSRSLFIKKGGHAANSWDGKSCKAAKTV